MYTKVCRNVVYILYTFCIHQLYTSCTIFLYKRYTQCPCEESKAFTSFVDCIVVDAKLVFVPRDTVVSDALIEVGVPLYLDTKL